MAQIWKEGFDTSSSKLGERSWTSGRFLGLFALTFGGVMGALAFFSVPGSLVTLFGVLCFGILASLWLRARLLSWFCLGALLLCCSALWHVHRLNGVALPYAGTYAALGTLIRVEPRDQAYRLLFEIALPEGRVPVRLTYHTPLERNGLYQLVFWAAPVSGPVYPGGFDPQFKFMFEPIHGFGRLRRATLISAEPPRWHGLEATRLAIDQRVRQVLPDQRGAVVSALLTGHRGNLNEETQALFRISGLAHLLAISGLHLSLVAGFAFFLIRALFWFWPSLALRLDQRRVGVVISMMAAFGYFALSGAAIPTQRALILVLATGGALLLKRQALSWRLWSLALFLVLLISPAQVFSISTHLSFLAVAILIRVAHGIQGWQKRRQARTLTPVHPVLSWGVGIVAAALAVNILTIPLLLVTFGQAPTFSFFANLIAVPLAGVALIPLALISLLAMPFGMEFIPLSLLGGCIDFLLGLARFIEGIGYNTLSLSKTPLPLVWPLLGAYVLILMPAGPLSHQVHRLMLIAGGVLIGLILLIPAILPKPLELHHPEGWVLRHRGQNKVENWGGKAISSYSFGQSRGLWSYEIDENTPLEPQARRLSCATLETGPIAIYQIRGHEVVVLDSWFRRQRFLG